MKQKDILLLIISSFALVVFWIIFNAYHNFVTSTIPEALTVQITPINPSFDTKTITALKQRTPVSPIYSPLATQSTTLIAPTTSIISTQSVTTPGGTPQQ